MKRLSTIIALALVITIGGVFAAWHYSDSNTSTEITRSGTMASVVVDGTMGSIEILKDETTGEARNNIKFLVDDPGEMDRVAELVPSGSAFIKFTPSVTAENDVITNGIKMKATVSLRGDQKDYNGVKIFTLAAETSFIINNTPSKGEVELKASDIANCLIFNQGQDVVLGSVEENEAYEIAMKSYIIVVTVSNAE